jgi:hypothetical protein
MEKYIRVYNDTQLWELMDSVNMALKANNVGVEFLDVSEPGDDFMTYRLEYSIEV